MGNICASASAPVGMYVCKNIHAAKWPYLKSGLRSRSHDRSWSRPESESEPAIFQTGVAAYVLSTDDNFGQTLTDPTKTLAYRKTMKVLVPCKVETEVRDRNPLDK